MGLQQTLFDIKFKTFFYYFVFLIQPSVRLTPAAILYSGKNCDQSHILVSIWQLVLSNIFHNISFQLKFSDRPCGRGPSIRGVAKNGVH